MRLLNGENTDKTVWTLRIARIDGKTMEANEIRRREPAFHEWKPSVPRLSEGCCGGGDKGRTLFK